MQAIGIRPADLAFAKQKDTAIKDIKSKMSAERAMVLSLHKDIVLAKESGGLEGDNVDYYIEAKNKFNAKYPENSIDVQSEKRSADTVRKNLKAYIVNTTDKQDSVIQSRAPWVFVK
jgi:hypothetical protein